MGVGPTQATSANGSRCARGPSPHRVGTASKCTWHSCVGTCFLFTRTSWGGQTHLVRSRLGGHSRHIPSERVRTREHNAALKSRCWRLGSKHLGTTGTSCPLPLLFCPDGPDSSTAARSPRQAVSHGHFWRKCPGL